MSRISTSTANADPAAWLQTLSARALKVRTELYPEPGRATMLWHEWGSGEPLVLLHGGSGSWTHWVRNIDALASSRRVLAADLPGLGDSDLPEAPYSAESLAAMVSRGIDALLPDSQPFDLVGFSFGGILGGHVALAQKRRIRSLTIAGAPAFGLPSSGPINEVVPVADELPADQARAIHEHNLKLFMIARPERVDALAIHLHGENIARARLRSRKIARSDTLARALRQVPCKLAGLFGSEDVSVHPSVDAHRTLFEEIQPGCRFEVLDGSGHWAAYEDHERFNTRLAVLLDD
ncbi:MAG: alpha/beta fold hydrolase [Gammaproteobacteria bacterium]|nr:alpha/beta fold hydrolase [Gammaproteobacteria bacterium]